jgi:hypothetical protein
MRYKVGFSLLLFLLAACDATTGPGRGGKVAVRFSTTSSAGVSANILARESPRIASDQLTLTGSNGSLVIEDIRFIVSELELRSSESSSCRGDDEGDDGDDDDLDDVDDEDEDDCEFEGGPFIVDLPLDGNASITTQTIPPGTYDAFKFEIDDLEADDDDDASEKQTIPALLAELRATYPNFPSSATMVVKGTQNGQPFIVYFKSELEIEQRIDPPLVVPRDNVLSVKLNPAAWFKSGDQVVNLLALNGRLVEFGSQFRTGLTGVHRGDD